MQLISLPPSPFAARVRIAIYARNLCIDIAPPPQGWPASRRFRELNPIGRIPVLVLDDGSAIPESSVILEFLEEQFADAPTLLPGDARARAKARLLARVVDLYLMPAMVALAECAGDEQHRRPAVEELLEGLAVVETLMEKGDYAAGNCLSIADCALAPAIFAARVTGDRLDVDLVAGSPRVRSYAERAQQDEHIGRVLFEMEEGMRQLTHPAPQ